MAILSYKYNEILEGGWQFSNVELDGKLNLMVGGTGSGKTRFLNTIFNMALFALNKHPSSNAEWDVKIEHDGNVYAWSITIDRTPEGTVITKEKLSKRTKDKEDVIVEREGFDFKFNGKPLPKLSERESSIYLLKNEELIKPLSQFFSRVMRRYFSEDALRQTCTLHVLDDNTVKKFENTVDLNKLFAMDLGLSAKLWFLDKHFPELYSVICDYYKDIFPFIRQVKVKKEKVPFPGVTPGFFIKEKKVDNWIRLDQLSSGMQKVLLILTDICTLPEGATYIIDEYENSLGINAIDFFPDFLTEFQPDAQIIVTSHHPYLINNIHPNNWFVFHRKGSEVIIKRGTELSKSLGKSKQQYFINLINDPFYAEGIE